MPNRITNYQCPACTGPLHYGEASGKLECDYCESKFDLAEIEAIYAPKNQAAEQANAKAEAEPSQPDQNAQEEEDVFTDQSEPWDMELAGTYWGADAQKMRAYSCPSCGAELILEETTAASTCPYCNNPHIDPSQFGGTKKPDLIIPFKYNKEAAINALKKHYVRKRLLPNAFTEDNHIEEIQGVYVPFWLFDSEVNADVTFKATRTHVHTTSKETVTETSHYIVRRSGNMRFEKIPVDGASKMPDGHMDAIEPFDYSELKPFSLAYLPGFMAEKYDVSKEECAKRADLRITRSAVQTLQNTVLGYETVVPAQENFAVHPKSVKYALMPVWMLTTKWNGQNFLFAMNGQTGRLIGDLPIDKKKLALWCAGAFAAATAAFGWIFLLL